MLCWNDPHAPDADRDIVSHNSLTCGRVLVGTGRNPEVPAGPLALDIVSSTRTKAPQDTTSIHVWRKLANLEMKYATNLDDRNVQNQDIDFRPLVSSMVRIRQISMCIKISLSNVEFA